MGYRAAVLDVGWLECSLQVGWVGNRLKAFGIFRASTLGKAAKYR